MPGLEPFRIPIADGLPKHVRAVLVDFIVTAASVVSIHRRRIHVLPTLETQLILTQPVEVALLESQLSKTPLSLQECLPLIGEASILFETLPVLRNPPLLVQFILAPPLPVKPPVRPTVKPALLIDTSLLIRLLSIEPALILTPILTPLVRSLSLLELRLTLSFLLSLKSPVSLLLLNPLLLRGDLLLLLLLPAQIQLVLLIPVSLTLVLFLLPSKRVDLALPVQVGATLVLLNVPLVLPIHVGATLLRLWTVPLILPVCVNTRLHRLRNLLCPLGSPLCLTLSVLLLALSVS